MSTEKGQKMTLKMSTEGNKIPLNFIMRVNGRSWIKGLGQKKLPSMPFSTWDGRWRPEAAIFICVVDATRVSRELVFEKLLSGHLAPSSIEVFPAFYQNSP